MFFAVNAADPADAAQDVNAFLASHTILSMTKELIREADRAYWSICVEYQVGNPTTDQITTSAKSKIDYRDVLSPEEFTVFSQLRDLRKKLAERDAIPVYAILSNAQLADMVQKKIISRTGLQTISGIGEGKITKYGDAFIDCLKQFNGGRTQ